MKKRKRKEEGEKEKKPRKKSTQATGVSEIRHHEGTSTAAQQALFFRKICLPLSSST